MTETGTVYGNALYELAASEELSEEILSQLQALSESFAQEPDFLKLLSAHQLSKAERCRIIDDGFQGKLHPYVINFLKILTEKGYVRHFSDCCKAYRLRYNDAHNILPVVAVTAISLRAEQHSRLKEKLEKQTGKTVQLTNRIDPAVIGGIRLDFDGKSMDDTVQSRLQSIEHLLYHTML